MQSDKYKRKVIEELTNELRELMDAPKKGNAKGKVKSMQRVYQESKEMFKKVEACSEHVHGREDEVRQMLENLLEAHNNGDYFLLAAGVGAVAGLITWKLIGAAVRPVHPVHHYHGHHGHWWSRYVCVFKYKLTQHIYYFCQV